MEKYFEPTGRLIMSIGKNLIKDLPAAVVELVKNAYDADAHYVEITYEKIDSKLIIRIADDGHGMDFNTVIEAWMVPSTSYKLEKRKSPKGRIYQGRKGIGRYAVSLLGNILILDTVKNGEHTKAEFHWNEFDTDKKLSEIPIEIKQEITSNKNGTTLTIINEDDNRISERIREDDAIRVEKELTKLLSHEENFEIRINYKNFFEDINKNIEKKINYIKLQDIYHYRLKGKISNDYYYSFVYENKYINEQKKLEGKFDSDDLDPKFSCGQINIDYRVYDKDKEGIDLIRDFLNSEKEVYYNRRELKNILKEQSGIGIYRNHFRIRPYGDKGFDWLNLDSKRVQNPAMAIGSEQISGRIDIESEELSGLKEKSARDGLYENQNFLILEKLANYSLALLQQERFEYRKKSSNPLSERSINNVIDFKSIRKSIDAALDEAYYISSIRPESAKGTFEDLKFKLNKEFENFEDKKNKELEVIQELIATYQKQTTLGKLIGVVLHEGRKPLGWYNNELPRMKRKLNAFYKKSEISEELYTYLVGTIERLCEESKRLSDFFKRLDPLASNRRKKRSKVNINEEIDSIIDLFQETAKENDIQIIFESEGIFYSNIVSDDLYMSLTNIVENAIFWVKYSKKINREIVIGLFEEDNQVIIDIKDNGPGISEEEIKKGLVFIPGYTGKNKVQIEGGTGLGLSIAGEAIKRNEGILQILPSNNGAHIQIVLKKGE